MATHDWTRRQVLGRAGAAAAGAVGLGLAGCTGGSAAGKGSSAASPSSTPLATQDSPAGGVQHFVSRPDLRPPAVTVTHPRPGPSAAGYIFLTPGLGGPGDGGNMICDTSGGLVWYSPATTERRKMDFRVQTYRGRPVLTWYEGSLEHGHGEGVAVIADASYRRTHTIQARQGLKVDLHEFVITPQGTALITAYRTATADLSGVGGPAKGTVLSGVAQEIDIATGQMLFEWDSLGHVAVTETYKKFSGGTAAKPFDYFHINSIAVAPDGDLIISARNTWAVYKVSRPAGAVVWRLGGRRSSFTMGTGTNFYWQHDARPHGTTLLSIFDDGATPKEEQRSRAILLDLDTTAMRAALKRQYTHPGLLAGAMGNVQMLTDGHLFVGWGTEPYFSEFSPDGRLLLDGRLPKKDPSYRAFRCEWSGHPTERPAAAARSSPAGGADVYASWNGATDVHSWAVLAGTTPSSLAAAGTAPRTGFESAIKVNSRGPFFAVEPRNARGHVLARSATVRLVTA